MSSNSSGGRTKEDIDRLNQIAEPVVSELVNQMNILTKGIVDAGFTEREAYHYVGYFLSVLTGRAASYELQAEAWEKKVRGFSAMDLLNAIGLSQRKAIQNISDGFVETMERDFGLDRKVFETEVQAIMMERAAVNGQVPPKDSKKWN